MSYSNYLRLTFLTPLFILGCGGSGEELTIDSSLINGISDPLVPYQWYLNNTGNDVFSSIKPTPGVDLNVASAWSQGITGQGVIVNVVDTGLEIAHPDLAANITTGSYNFDDSSSDPTNTINSDGDHGTSVAGLIAMVGNNGIGGKGVAYNAKLMGYNFIKDKSPQSVENLAKSFGGSASDASAKAHVFNASWGVSTCSLGPVSSGFMVDQSLTTVKSLRNGKGGLIIKSSGNGFFHQENCGFSKIPGVSSANAAFDNTNTLDHLILAAAVNANGKKSSYSTTGANIWVSGFGGE
jgi:subtilisin family serine protease